MIETFDDVDDAYWGFDKVFNEVFDEHIPVQTKVVKHSETLCKQNT